MDPTEQQARECYELSRAFFKGGAKAYNRGYLPGVNPIKAAAANEWLADSEFLPDISRHNPSHVMLGQLLRETGNTRGSSREMTGVAASYVEQHMPGINMTVAAATEHFFLIVGSIPSNTSVDGLRRVPPEARSYVVDVWAGVCCHTSRYPDCLKAKMDRWDRQGKIILARGQAQRTAQWVSAVLTAGVRGIDPHYMPRPVNKATILDAVEQETASTRQALLENADYLQKKEQRVVRQQQMITASPADYLREQEARVGRKLRQVNIDLAHPGWPVDRQATLAERAELHREQDLMRRDPNSYLGAKDRELSSDHQEVSEQKSALARNRDVLVEQDRQRQGPVVCPTQRFPRSVVRNPFASGSNDRSS